MFVDFVACLYPHFFRPRESSCKATMKPVIHEMALKHDKLGTFTSRNENDSTLYNEQTYFWLKLFIVCLKFECLHANGGY